MTNKKKKLSYWDRRAIDQDIKVHNELNAVENKVMKSYQKAQFYLTDEVKKIYRRYLAKSELSEEEVKKVLYMSVSPTNIVDLQTIVKTVKDVDIKKQAQNYLTGMAVKNRITRLEDLKAKSYLVSKQVADVQLSQSTDYYIDVIKEAYNQASAEAIIGNSESALRLYDDGKYPTYVFEDDKTFIEIADMKTGKSVKRIEIQRDEVIPKFKEMSTKQVRNVLDTRWQGSNYSKRIWDDTDLLAKKLEELFTVEAMTGMSERDMVKEIQTAFDVSRGVARRLVRTEANYMAGQGKLKGWVAQGVEYYVIVATLDLRTSKICQEQDGKKYKVSEAKVNINYPPFHPWCRSVVRAWFNERTLSAKRIANDPITGERFEISHADSYKKWEQMLIDKHGKEDLQIVRKKVKNFNADLEQFNHYKKALNDEDLPKTLDEFQDIKYSDSVKYEELKKKYLQLFKKTG
ncbi:MAG: minor capsid protein [Carnobacterium sp.]|uniref:minor capsid protein n=1 Tax=Carnobacterium sp. TaxID=48221 RepID=UPI0033162A97